MFTHIVFFKLKNPTTENISKIKTDLESLPAVVPEIRLMEVGTDIIRGARSYDISLLSRFDSKEDMESYQIHPEHRKVASEIMAMCENVAAVDYEN